MRILWHSILVDCKVVFRWKAYYLSLVFFSCCHWLGQYPTHGNLLGFGQSSVWIRLKCARWMSGPWLYPSLLHPWTSNLSCHLFENSERRNISGQEGQPYTSNFSQSKHHCRFRFYGTLLIWAIQFQNTLKKWYEKSHETSLMVSWTLNSPQFCVTYKWIETLILHLT